jgi:hypothetical protein
MKINKMLTIAALLAMTAGTAFAQGAGAPPAGGGMAAGGMAAGGGMAACRDDMQKFCADKTGADRRACMDTNKDKLSDTCKAARAARASGQ